MKLKAISIDDDPMSILMIENLSKKVNELDLVNTYNDPIKGAAGIILDKPDLLFLDIDMPEFNGIEIMDSLVRPPKIVVISANPNYKERVIDLEAVAFIKKPVGIKEFTDAVEKVRALLMTEQAQAE
ncbi:MAG: response regulator [Cyclobacteriaceae bacterium]